jgi:hypothetical protein
MRAQLIMLFLIPAILSIGAWPADAAPRPTAATTSHGAAAAWRGIGWETSLSTAKAKAVRSGKPLLVLHLFGRLDEEFC